MTLSVSILGASGFAGGELVRLLVGHPELDPVALGSQSRAGAHVGDVLPHLVGTLDLTMTTLDAAAQEATDVCFSCLPLGALASIEDSIAAACIVDLSGDHRADPRWVYGLSEHARDKIAGSRRIANPGCYPTAALLAVVPLAAESLITGPVIVDALSGTSGAGRSAGEELSFAAMHGGARAYAEIPHRHVAEMERGIENLAGAAAPVSFTPHLVPMARGVLVTVRATLTKDLTDADLEEVMDDAYANEPFVTALDGWPDTKAVAGSNRALVHARVDAGVGMVVASCAIDNLGKGAAGQAIQNANLALGIEETAGLSSLGVWP